MVLPDQVARPRVERLDDVRRVVEIHDAVVHERARFVALAFVHRPDPRQLQLLDVVACDLGQRAVAPALVVAPRHQPVARIRIAQHLVGHGNVVLHLARDGDAERARRRAPPRPPAPGALCPPGASPLTLAGTGGRWRGSRRGARGDRCRSAPAPFRRTPGTRPARRSPAGCTSSPRGTALRRGSRRSAASCSGCTRTRSVVGSRCARCS